MRKNYFARKILTAESLATDVTSDAIDVTTCDNFGVNITTSGVTDNTGIFYIDHRIYDHSTRQGSGWAELTLGSTPQLADADQTLLINLNQLPHGQIRVRFVAAGTTPNGTADFWVSGTEV